MPATIISDTTLSDANVCYTADSSITIPSGITLTVNKGVKFRFRDDTAAAIVVFGSLVINGTEQDPVTITLRDDPTNSDTARWGYIFSNYGDLKINYVNVSKGHRFVCAMWGTAQAKHCHVDSTFATSTQDCIGIHNASDVLVEYCELHGPGKKGADCIDCDSIITGTVRYNKFYNFNDDAIDIGHDSYDFTVHDNYVYNCANGISIGEHSKALFSRNIISTCTEAAIEVHTGAFIKAVNNTFYKNRLGVRCNHMGSDSTGGSADIVNTIFANTVDTVYQIQPSSVLHISYSLSTKDSLPGGANNLIGDPLFANPAQGDFRLANNSPCINHGNPADTVAACDTRTDIGAVEFDCHAVRSETTAPAVRADGNDAVFRYYPQAAEIVVINTGTTMHNALTLRIFRLDGTCIKAGTLAAGDTHFSIEDLRADLYIVEMRGEKHSEKTYHTRLMVTK